MYLRKTRLSFFIVVVCLFYLVFCLLGCNDRDSKLLSPLIQEEEEEEEEKYNKDDFFKVELVSSGSINPKERPLFIGSDAKGLPADIHTLYLKEGEKEVFKRLRNHDTAVKNVEIEGIVTSSRKTSIEGKYILSIAVDVFEFESNLSKEQLLEGTYIWPEDPDSISITFREKRCFFNIFNAKFDFNYSVPYPDTDLLIIGKGEWSAQYEEYRYSLDLDNDILKLEDVADSGYLTIRNLNPLILEKQ